MGVRAPRLTVLKTIPTLLSLLVFSAWADTHEDCNRPLPPVQSEMQQLRDDHRAMLIAALRLDNDTPHPICSVTINSTTKDEVLKERFEPWSETESDWQILLVDGEPPSRRDLRKERRYPRPPVPTDFWGGYVRFIDFDGVTVTEETSEYVKFTGKHVVPVTTNGERGEDMVSTVEVYVDPATDLLQRFNVELDDSYRFSRLFALVESRQEMSFVDRSDFAFPRYDAVTMDATVRITLFKTSMVVDFDILEIDCPAEKQLPVCEASE